MSLLVPLDLDSERAAHLKDVGGHLYDYLQTAREASMPRLIHEAERWFPGDSGLDWESIVADAMSWGIQRGDFGHTSTGVRMLPSWALGPFEWTDGARDASWAVRLHGDVPRGLFSRLVHRHDLPAIATDGVGIGRSTFAIARKKSDLIAVLSENGLEPRAWPAIKQVLMDRRDEQMVHRISVPEQRLSHAVLGRTFGRYRWTSAPVSRMPVRGLARLDTDNRRKQYFLTDGLRPVAEITSSEFVTQIWQLHLLAADGKTPPAAVVRPMQSGVVFPGRTVPPLLVRCLLPFDTGPGVNRFPSQFTLPMAIRGQALLLVGEFVWRLSDVGPARSS